MGIVNVTPDSFSDGGQFSGAAQAVEHAMQLRRDGAAIIDIGGESTRPYSDPISIEEELQRVVPVIKELVSQIDVPISIDTSKAEVARQAVAAGAKIINDVSGLEADPEMLQVVIESGAAVCVMHMQGTPKTMQNSPTYVDVVEDIFAYLQRRKTALVSAGIGPEKICLDPGIGFGKTHEHNLALIAQSDRFHELGCPLLVGHSRKGFIGKVLDLPAQNERDWGTLGASIHLANCGIQLLRLHIVRPTSDVFRMLDAIEKSPSSASARTNSSC